MKKNIKNIILAFLKNNSGIKNRLLSVTAAYLKGNRSESEYFLKLLFPNLSEEVDKYPSLFNKGYLHIEKGIAMAQFLKLPSDGLIIDVGAATGITPLLFSEKFPSSEIYAFEPIPDTFMKLQEVTAGIASIHTVNKALGNEKKQADIHLASRATSSSLLNIDKNISNEFWRTNLKEEGSISVSVSRLDDEIPSGRHINILKMDVQGYELEVLKGGAVVLKRTAVVLIEMQNHALYMGAPRYFDLDEHLRNAGFELFDMIPSIRQDNKLYEWDAIYVNKKFVG